MPNYKKSGSDAPSQNTSVSDASTPFMTNKDGVIYNEEIARKAKDYLAGEGSMGWDRNQGVKRDGWMASEEEGGTMGQNHLKKLKESSTGSHAI